jgi:hypothetical protein
LIVRGHVRAPPRRNAVTRESHSDGQRAGYFLRTLQTLLLVLGYSDPHSSSEQRGCFVGTHFFGAYVW